MGSLPQTHCQGCLTYDMIASCPWYGLSGCLIVSYGERYLGQSAKLVTPEAENGEEYFAEVPK